MPFRLRYLVVPLVLVGLAAAALWAVPSDGYIFAPDRAKPLAADVRVPGAHPPPGGDVYYVDAIVRRASLLERIVPFTRPDGATLVPAGNYLPQGVTEQERERQIVSEMQRSTKIAPAVALSALGRDVRAQATGITFELTLGTIANPAQPSRPIVGIQVDQAAKIKLPVKVSIDIGRVGGPSAGLPFALEIARMLGRDVTHGCRVAATGELALDGTVLPVGAVKQKTVGARRTGVDLFIVPRGGKNEADARSNAHGLRILAVSSFQQALRELATHPPKC